MSFLLALVAFAAVIAVYSTIVSVIVEGLHKLFGLRSAGMSEMLRAFYDQHLARLQPDNTPPEALAPVRDNTVRGSPQAQDFARAMARHAPSENVRFWYIRRLWPFKYIFTSRRQRMSTLEFIEQLAETPQGAALAGHDREGLRAALAAAAYDFERLGESQGVYFRSRAKFLSVITGIVVAFFVNIDAIALYKELASNATLSARISTLGESGALLALGDSVNAGTISVEQANELRTNLAGAASEFTSLGIPVGRSMFPHCQGYVKSPGPAQASQEGSDAPLPDPLDTFVDDRCALSAQEDVNATWAQTYAQFLDDEGIEASWGNWFSYRWQRITAVFNNFQTFFMWFIGVIIAGGLLGLGAPFWFKLFTRGAALVAPMARAQLAAAPAANAPTRVEARPEDTTVRNPTHASVEDLERGYLTVLGRTDLLRTPAESLSGGPVPGREYGVRPPVRRVDPSG